MAQSSENKPKNLDGSIPNTYLDWDFVKVNLKVVERKPDSEAYLYRRVMAKVLRYFFLEREDLEIYYEISHVQTARDNPETDDAAYRFVVLQYLTSPEEASQLSQYNYCLAESKGPSADWNETRDLLSKHCGESVNESKQVYGIVHVGLHVQFFSANHGSLTELSTKLHLRDDVQEVTDRFAYPRRHPLPVL